MLRFDLVDLRLFLHIVEQGSITAGAARAHLSLAAASARLTGMEKTLRLALLTRGPRGVQPTPAGRSLAHHARVVLDQMSRMRGELQEHARGLRGHVRLLCNTAVVSEYLPELLGGFLIANPLVDVAVEEQRSDLIVRAIAEGRADLGIVADSAPVEGLESLLLREDRLVMVAPSSHPLGTRKRLRFRDLVEENFVGLAIGSALRAHLDEHAAQFGKALRYRVTFRSFDAVCRTVAQGVGIAIVPASAAERCKHELPLRIVALQDGWANRRLLVVSRRRNELTDHARRLLDRIAVRGAATELATNERNRRR